MPKITDRPLRIPPLKAPCEDQPASDPREARPIASPASVARLIAPSSLTYQAIRVALEAGQAQDPREPRVLGRLHLAEDEETKEKSLMAPVFNSASSENVPPERNEPATSSAPVTTGWQPIDTAPQMRKVIVFYRNALGKKRTVMACYYRAHSLEMADDYDDVGDYDAATGESFAPAGWYEEHDASEPLMPLQEEPTHWMPLPLAPGVARSADVAPSEQPANHDLLTSLRELCALYDGMTETSFWSKEVRTKVERARSVLAKADQQ